MVSSLRSAGMVSCLLTLLACACTGMAHSEATAPDAATAVLRVRVEGDGDVTPPPGDHPYPLGAVVYLDAAPRGKSAFVAWTGDTYSAGPCTAIRMDGPKTVTAVFREDNVYRIEVGVGGPGTGVTIPPPGVYYFRPGYEVRFRAVPAEGMRFGGWSVREADGSETVVEFLPLVSAPITDNGRITALFDPQPCTITIEQPAFGGQSWPEAGAYAVAHGATLRIEAEAFAGWTFSHWEDSGGTHLGEEGKLVLLVEQDVHLRPVFVSCLLTLCKAGAGNGTTDPPSTWWPGVKHDPGCEKSVTLTATPDAHSTFSDWTGDLPESVDATSPEIVIETNRPRQITANFYRPFHRLTVYTQADTSEASRERLYTAEFLHDDTILYAVTPQPGTQRVVSSWSGDIAGKEPIFRAIMDSDKELVANIDPENGADTHVLTVTPPEGDGRGWVLPLAPGQYRYPAGTTVALEAIPGFGSDFVAWSGDLAGTGASRAAITLGVDRTVGAIFRRSGADAEARGCSEVAGVESVSFDVAVENGVGVHGFLNGGGLAGWFSAPHFLHTPFGVGFSQLAHERFPNRQIFGFIGLNLEHIFNGSVEDAWRMIDTPRRDPMRVAYFLPGAVRVTWPAAESTWDLDCEARYYLSGSNAIDIEASVTPRKDHFKFGWVAAMWASYMQFTRGREIHFIGTDGDREGWTAFGADRPDGSFETGQVAFHGAPPLPYDETVDFNTVADPNKQFVHPFYYGLVDADGLPDTTDDDMAFIMMFDQAESIRFALYNWGGDPRYPAWDWQFIIRDPQIDKTYRFRARMVYKPFEGQDDVRAEYERWRAKLP